MLSWIYKGETWSLCMLLGGGSEQMLRVVASNLLQPTFDGKALAVDGIAGYAKRRHMHLSYEWVPRSRGRWCMGRTW
jgi:hypothetical protein